MFDFQLIYTIHEKSKILIFSYFTAQGIANASDAFGSHHPGVVIVCILFPYSFELIFVEEFVSFLIYYVVVCTALVVDGSWNFDSPRQIQLNTQSYVTNLLPVSYKLWCSSGNEITKLDPALEQAEVCVTSTRSILIHYSVDIPHTHLSSQIYYLYCNEVERYKAIYSVYFIELALVSNLFQQQHYTEVVLSLLNNLNEILSTVQYSTVQRLKSQLNTYCAVVGISVF